MRKLNSIVALFTALSLTPTAQAATLFLENYNSRACGGQTSAIEPNNQISSYSDDRWTRELLSQTKLFKPERTKRLVKKSGIERDDVSSSHIVQIVAEGLRKIEQTETKIQKENGAIEIGKTYGESDLREREEKLRKARNEKILPELEKLYGTYLAAVIKRHEDKQKPRNNEKAEAKTYTRAKNQVAALNGLLHRLLPSVSEKLGDVETVTDQNLPLSYRDGYIVKLRFQKAGETDHVTLYPRAVLNQILDRDGFFLEALRRWKSYTRSKVEVAEQILNHSSASGLVAYVVMKFAPEKLNKWLGYDGSISSLQAKLEVMKEAQDLASEDFKTAKWAAERLHQLTEPELLSLMDMFRALRFDDVPACQESLTEMDADMTKKLISKGSDVKSTADKRFSSAEKSEIDSLAKSVAFYRDIYETFTELSAYQLAKKYSVK
jgi:hypothetical protein